MSVRQRIVLASNNPGKIREINALLSDTDIEVVSQAEFDVPGVEETGFSFVENALIKARHAAGYCPYPVIADDSGIALDALDGRPGIYSARYAGACASDEQNLYKLIDEIRDLPEHRRRARFVCLMVYLQYETDPVPLIAEGVWHGVALTEPRGDNGFGYDPMFYVPEHGCTSAELDPETKNRLSHRGQALRKLIGMLKVKVDKQVLR